MCRGQSVKRNTNRGILLNFNYPQPGMYQFTSLDPSPVTGTWDGGVYPTFAPLSFTENMVNFGAVPTPPDNTNDPDRPNGVMSPHGFPLTLPIDVQFDPGAFNALLFRADGSVRAVNAANNPGVAAVNIVGVDFQVVLRDTTTQITKTLTISRNGRVLKMSTSRESMMHALGTQSLIEVMVAIMILTVGLLSFAQMMVANNPTACRDEYPAAPRER
jgi:hypothetical protein